VSLSIPLFRFYRSVSVAKIPDYKPGSCTVQRGSAIPVEIRVMASTLQTLGIQRL
jgi:hypothetical protein